MSDLLNGSFEFFGALLLSYNCYLTFKAKKVEGISKVTTSFFASWGLWNLYYYPHLGQWLSFVGGCAIVIANGFWVGLMWVYRNNR